MLKPSCRPSFLNFCGPSGSGEKSATAAQNRPMSIRSQQSDAASNISRALPTPMRSTPAGRSGQPGPHTAVTPAPRSQAAVASAAPMVPLLGLVQ